MIALGADHWVHSCPWSRKIKQVREPCMHGDTTVLTTPFWLGPSPSIQYALGLSFFICPQESLDNHWLLSVREHQMMQEVRVQVDMRHLD